MKKTINTREDLDALLGTQAYDDFILHLKGTMVRRVNAAVYPENYDNTLQPGDTGYVAPDWQEVEDLSVIQRFGFVKTDFNYV